MAIDVACSWNILFLLRRHFEYSFPVAASFSPYPDRTAHRGAHVIRYLRAGIASAQFGSTTLGVPLRNSSGVLAQITVVVFS